MDRGGSLRRTSPPEPAVMCAEVKAHHARQDGNYLDSERYILEVDYRNYSQAFAQGHAPP